MRTAQVIWETDFYEMIIMKCRSLYFVYDATFHADLQPDLQASS